MITTGGENYWKSQKTEIVDVVNGETCSDLAKFPVPLSNAVGANLNGTPIVCGGFDAFQIAFSEKCYRFTNSGWEKFTSMKETRIQAAGVMNNKKLHVFGGRNDQWEYIYLKTSETINVDGGVGVGPDLPRGIHAHAMTAINGTVSFLSGGQLDKWTNANYYSDKTWYYNHESESFTSGPNLLEARQYHRSATIIDKVTKVKITVVSGGEGNSGYMKSTELLINGQWQTGTIHYSMQTAKYSG